MFGKYKFLIISFLAVLSFIFIAGCASTAQQVGDNKYRTDCSGMFSSKSDCYAEAERVCDGKFNEINMAIRDQGDVWDAFCECYIYVIKRNLTFSCR
jgi:hypothetical protein